MRTKKLTRWIGNRLKYGIGDRGRERKLAAKMARREQKFESERWNKDGELAKRQYANYGEYVEHQGAKLDDIIHRLRETEQEDYADFKERFEQCQSLQQARSVLCLGARLGTEVSAMHALGHFAIGIDLNPGQDNAYVLPGDFHAIVFPDGSVDAIYTNVMDHVFDLDKIMAEVNRLLAPDGLFVADLIQGYEEGFTPGEFEATHWANTDDFMRKLSDLTGFEVIEDRMVGQRRNNTWRQVVFQKPTA